MPNFLTSQVCSPRATAVVEYRSIWGWEGWAGWDRMAGGGITVPQVNCARKHSNLIEGSRNGMKMGHSSSKMGRPYGVMLSPPRSSKLEQ